MGVRLRHKQEARCKRSQLTPEEEALASGRVSRSAPPGNTGQVYPAGGLRATRVVTHLDAARPFHPSGERAGPVLDPPGPLDSEAEMESRAPCGRLQRIPVVR